MAIEHQSLYDQALEKFVASVRKEGRVKEGDEDAERQLQGFLKDRATSRDAKAAADALKTASSSKYGAKKVGDKEVLSQKWVDNIMGNIQNAIQVGDVLLKHTPESVSMAWFCIKLGLNGIQSNYALYGLFGAGLTNVTELMILIPHYDQLYDRREDAEFETNDLVKLLFRDIVDVYVAILDFVFSIKRHVEAGKLGKLRHALKDMIGYELTKFQDKQKTITMYKEKVLERSEAAFQKRTFDQSSAIQLSLKQNVDAIRHFNSTALELAQGQTELLREMQEFKTMVKPKSRWDWAKQEYDDITKLLDPLPDQTHHLKGLVEIRANGTTQWVFDTLPVAEFMSDTRGDLLCVSGMQGTGKSVAAASIVERMQQENESIHPATLYVHCAPDDLSYADLGPSPSKKILHTILHQIHKLALSDVDDHELLEKSNKAIKPDWKNDRQRGTTGGDGGQNGLVPLRDAFEHLLTLHGKRVLVMVDAIGVLPDREQTSLYDDLAQILHACLRLRVLVTCRSNQTFNRLTTARNRILEMRTGNQVDLANILKTALSRLPGWTATERDEASDKVLEKSGGDFRYINNIALPFLQQPFQRPLSRRLAYLPEGLADAYRRWVRNLEPNYLALLRTALEYTLLSPFPVRVKEIMDNHYGLFDSGEPIDKAIFGHAHDATELQIQQLRDAGEGPFLRIWKNSEGDHVVTLQDPPQIQEYCKTFADPASIEQVIETGHICANCQGSIDARNDLVLLEKDLHLRQALRCMRFLNHQSSVALCEIEIIRPGVDPSDDGVPQSAGDSPIIPEPPQDWSDLPIRRDSPANDSFNQQDPTTSSRHPNDDLVGNDGISLSDNASAKYVHAYVSSSTSSTVSYAWSQDSEDRPDFDRHGDDDDDLDDIPAADEDGRNVMRYDISRWHEHVRRADELWSAEDKTNSDDWRELIAQLDKYAFEDNWFWTNMQSYYLSEEFDERDGLLAPLHFASFLGLTYWARHLIEDKHQDPNEISLGMTALQAASCSSRNLTILALLLDQPRIDAVYYDTQSEHPVPPALYTWLGNDGRQECVKLFLDHNVDFTIQPKEHFRGATALHNFAKGPMPDPESLHLIMSSEQHGKKPDINAKDVFDSTPLHTALSSEGWPSLELIRAFIKHGADVNAEREGSDRPLQLAVRYRDIEFVRLIMESTIQEIDDPDESGATALHTAALFGKDDCVRLLSSAGANPNHADGRKRTAIHHAAIRGNAATVKALLEVGTDPLLLDDEYHSALWFACSDDNEEKALFILGTLIQQSHTIGEIDRPSKHGRTPLRVAAEHGKNEVVKLILQTYAKAGPEFAQGINMVSRKKKHTALHRAAFRGQATAVELLIDHGADTALTDWKGKTALQIASTEWLKSGTDEYEQIVFRLLEKDALQAQSDHELPAIAAMNNSVRVLRRLRRLGADLTRPDSHGWTPLSLAQTMGNPAVREYLTQQATRVSNIPSVWLPPPQSDRIDIDKFLSGLEIHYANPRMLSLCADRPVPHDLHHFYFEVTIESEIVNGEVAIGFCTLGAQHFYFPGHRPRRSAPLARSWAWHGGIGLFWADNEVWFGSGPENHTPALRKVGKGDTMGCGVDVEKGVIWYTKNGNKLAFEHDMVFGRLFPILGLKGALSLKTNFGAQPFMWKKGDQTTSGDLIE